MIGTSGADALSRAVGDEQLRRVQRSTNDANRKKPRDQKGRKHNDKDSEDVFEVSGTNGDTTVSSFENEHPASEDLKSDTGSQSRQSDKTSLDENGHIDVTG